MRGGPVLALVAVAVMAVSACSPGPEEDGTYAAEFAKARNDATTEVARKILEDDVITEAEFRPVQDASIQCMRDQGLTVELVEGVGSRSRTSGPTGTPRRRSSTPSRAEAGNGRERSEVRRPPARGPLRGRDRQPRQQGPSPGRRRLPRSRPARSTRSSSPRQHAIARPSSNHACAPPEEQQ